MKSYLLWKMKSCVSEPVFATRPEPTNFPPLLYIRCFNSLLIQFWYKNGWSVRSAVMLASKKSSLVLCCQRSTHIPGYYRCRLAHIDGKHSTLWTYGRSEQKILSRKNVGTDRESEYALVCHTNNNLI